MKARELEKMTSQRHSEMGIASFVISIASVILTSLAIVFIKSSSMDISDNFVEVILGIFFLFIVISLGLGIAGLFQKERRKVFAVLGMAIPSCTILLFIIQISYVTA